MLSLLFWLLKHRIRGRGLKFSGFIFFSLEGSEVWKKITCKEPREVSPASAQSRAIFTIKSSQPIVYFPKEYTKTLIIKN